MLDDVLHRIQRRELRVNGAPTAISRAATGAPRSYGPAEAPVRHDEVLVGLRRFHDPIDIVHAMRRLGVSAGAWIMHGQIVGPGNQHRLLRLVVVGGEFIVGQRPVKPDAVFRLQTEITGMKARALGPPAIGAAAERDRIVPGLFSRTMRVKLFRIVNRVGPVLDLPIVGLVSAPFDDQNAAGSRFLEQLLQEEQRAETRPDDHNLVMRVHSIGKNERHNWPSLN
ncbi:hypothetical protein, partial [Bradyrhizobium sp.]|uniref:hypothetical protein n=1 Tax=Bradyrhizobium sp. TaxID=376 RepID=UPI003C4FC13A